MGISRVLFPLLTLASSALSADLPAIQIKVGLRILNSIKLAITFIQTNLFMLLDLILTLHDQSLGLQVLLRKRNSILLQRSRLPTGLLCQWRSINKHDIRRSVVQRGQLQT